jgi:hypothetical protein
VPILFGTYNGSTATSAEVKLSQSFQTAFANFAKNPNSSPAPHWRRYKPEVSANVYAHTLAKNPNLSPAPHWRPYEPELSGNVLTPTLAKIAYEENVDFGNFVERVLPDSIVSTRNNDAKFSLLIYEFLAHKQDGPCSLWDPFLDYRP